mgnify:CR=1 FL=1
MSDKARLLRQIAELRRQIDPEILRRAELAQQGRVPYDQANAQEAIKRFLESQPDGNRLRALLKRKAAERPNEEN